ncbi:hypothetical protein HHK36_019581 [Tetracentron sinense]|uniref:RAVE complex protein Rav1 C-terminal domain-containing protein n=1 Tax=Tetracentron sinense TaxID=13715 RepID=A0A834Z1K2_TETSI|nr:hypothetical protein HHK36_019581 [Tetracentron sinense]
MDGLGCNVLATRIWTKKFQALSWKVTVHFEDLSEGSCGCSFDTGSIANYSVWSCENTFSGISCSRLPLGARGHTLVSGHSIRIRNIKAIGNARMLHLVGYLTSANASEKGYSSAKSSHIIPQIHLSNYFQVLLSTGSGNKGLQWGGDTATVTSASQLERSLIPFVGYNSEANASDNMFSPTTGKSDISGFIETLEKFHDLAAITNMEKIKILAVIDLLGEISDSCSPYGSLDEPGRRDLVLFCEEVQFLCLAFSRFWVAVRFQRLYFLRRFGRLATMEELVVNSELIGWAFHSDCQENLFDSVLSKEPSWREMRNFGVGFWFTNATQLRTRLELVIAFVLLGADPSSAIIVCAKNLEDEQLALIICRLLEGYGGTLERHLISKFLLPAATEKGDYWHASLLEWALGNYYQSYLKLLGLQVGSVVNKSALSSNHTAFLNPDIGQYCLTLSTKNSLRNAVGECGAAILARWATLMNATASNRRGISISLYCCYLRKFLIDPFHIYFKLEALECLSSSLSIIEDKDQYHVSDIGNLGILKGIRHPSPHDGFNWLSAWLQRNMKSFIMMIQPILVTYTDGHTPSEIDVANLKKLLYQEDERWQLIGACLWRHLSNFTNDQLKSVYEDAKYDYSSSIPPDPLSSLVSSSAYVSNGNSTLKQIKLVSMILIKLLKNTLAHISSYHAKQLALFLQQKVEKCLPVPTLAMCINSIDQQQDAVASNRKGIIFFKWKDEAPFRDQSDYIWSAADWPQNGWAGLESTPIRTVVSPGGLTDGGAFGIPGYAGIGASGLGWGIQEDFEEFVDPPATVENVRTGALSSHPSRPLFLVGSSNTHVYLWEFGKDRATATYGVLPAANVPPPYALASISALQFDHCGHRFVTAALDGTVCTWQLEVGGRSNVRPTESSLCFNSHTSDVSYVAASGSIIAAAGYSSNGVNVVIWDTLAPPTTSQASITCHEGILEDEVGQELLSPCRTQISEVIK